MRLFVALDLPEDVRHEVGRRGTEARRELPRAHWVRPEALHLTLAFLGEQSADVLPTLDDHLAPAFSAVAPFELRLHHGGTFPPQRPARVAWVGVVLGNSVETGDPLKELARRVQGALQRSVDYQPDHRGFTAHLTVARCKQPWRRREIEKLERHFRGFVGEAFEVTEGVLYESTLGPSGARYRALRRFPLGPGREPLARREVAG